MLSPVDRRRVRDRRGHHPWQTFGLFPEWTVEFVPARALPPKHLGMTVHHEKRVLIRKGLTVAARRSTLCHETGHVLRGEGSACHSLAEESLVERQAARLLLPSVIRLGHSLAWHDACYTSTARDLWVDEKLLNARLSTLAPRERTYLDEQLATILV